MDYFQKIEECIPALRRYANALLHDPVEADDLVQDCLERALRKRLLWRPKSAMRPWLFTILHNIYVNNVRKNIRQPSMESLDQSLMQFTGLLDAEMLMDDIEKSINQLTDNQKKVLLLVSLEGFSYKEVSKILNIPLGTVMSRLSRAREIVKKGMEGEIAPTLRRIK